MIGQNGKKHKTGSVNPVVVGATGAVIGAGIAVAATQALKSEKTRKKIKSTIRAAKDRAMEQMPQMRSRIQADILKLNHKKINKTVKAIKKNGKAKKRTGRMATASA